MSVLVKLWVICVLCAVDGGIATVSGCWWVCALIGIPIGWLVADVEALTETQRSPATEKTK